MAETHVEDGLLDGPIIEVVCSPVPGSSVGDLSAETTEFECFVANHNNQDGSRGGEKYNATVNWVTGSYTYGWGAP